MQNQVSTPPTPFDGKPKRKITFSELPVLVHQQSVPVFEYVQPPSILKRKFVSLYQQPTSDLVGDNTVQTFEMPFIQKRKKIDKFKFNIDSAPLLPQQILMMQKEAMLREAAQNSGSQRPQLSAISREVDQSNPREMKIPTWFYFLFGFCVLVIGGWIISRAFFTKINDTSRPVIFKKPNHFREQDQNNIDNQLRRYLTRTKDRRRGNKDKNSMYKIHHLYDFY